MFFTRSAISVALIVIVAALVISCGTAAQNPAPTSAAKMEHPTEMPAFPSPTEPPMMPTEAAMSKSPTFTPTMVATAEPTATSIAMQEQPKPAWKQLAVENAPAPRYDHTLALDVNQQRLILFGGRDGSQVFGDTWIYDLKVNQWREVNGAGPSARFGLASAYDPSRHAVYIFGGQNQEFYNDTWMFDTLTETWSEIQTTDPKPDIRYGHGVTLDLKSDRLIVSHGFARDGRHDDTWALDLKSNSWKNLTPTGDKPLKRCLTDIAYAPNSDSVYLFGGCSSGFGPCPQGDLWMLDLKADKWTELEPPGDAPSARENLSLVLDERAGRLILFGGKGTAAMNDLWVYDPTQNAWRQVSLVGPGARKSHDAVYDASGNLVFLFGGTDGSRALNDLWVLSLG